MRVRTFASVCGLVLAACAAAPAVTPSARPDLSVEPSVALTASPSPAPITVTSSRYGQFEIRTRPLETCQLAVRVSAGIFGDGPPHTLAGKADALGTLAWSYPAPLVPAGRGSHVVTCSTDELRAEFDVTIKGLEAKAFTARVQPVDPIGGLEGLSTRLEASLVPVRDAAVAKLNETLGREWTTATRGLGALTLVPSSADIVIYVIPGRSSSLHSLAPDGTQRILLYTVDELGPVSPENSVATALHELGHIWCCRGPDAGSDGHWLEKTPDPLLQGIDRFGLMTHPVTCLVGRDFQSCPNRFSERELRAMGFTEIPAPPPDPCVTQANALRSQVATLDASLSTARGQIDAARAEAASIAARIADIERQYSGRPLPPDVYATYVALIDQHNRIVSGTEGRVAAYNRDVDKRNALAQQLNALPC